MKQNLTIIDLDKTFKITTEMHYTFLNLVLQKESIKYKLQKETV